MGLPMPLVSSLQRAWRAQQRWLQLGNHIGSAPLTGINVLPQGDPFSPLALNACIAEAIHRITLQFGSSRNLHTAYLDDRTWTFATAAECLDIADVWATETPNLGLSENKSKLEFSAVGTKANTEELAMELQAREIHNPPDIRPKILGTRLILNRRHAGAEQEETKALTKAVRLTTWIRALPYSLEEKLYFYKATAVAVVAASRYVRLFSQENLNPIRRAMSDLDHNGHHSLGHVGSRWRLFQGHAADPYFRVGSSVAVQTLHEASAQESPQWHTCQTQGPQFLLKRWLQRQGWRNTGPLDMDTRCRSIRLTISLAVQMWPDGTDHYAHIYPQKTAESKRSTAHFLRDAWRAHQWEQFLGCGSRAVASLHQLPWNAVKQQWQRARHLLSRESDLYRHLLAVYIDHWVSQARLRHTQNQPVLPCNYCGHHSPDRTHEWWYCPVLANTASAPYSKQPVRSFRMAR